MLVGLIWIRATAFYCLFCTYKNVHDMYVHTLTHSHTHTYRQTSLHQQLSQFSFPVPLTLLQSSFRCIYILLHTSILYMVIFS